MFLQPPAQYPSTKMLQAVNIWVDFYWSLVEQWIFQ
jgi:hypothetical protein